MENATILIRGARIVAVGADIACPAGAAIVDARGKCVMPGLIDNHVHMGGRTDIVLSADSRAQRLFGGRDFTANYAEARTSALQHGVTTVRSCGDYARDILMLREETAAGLVAGPRIVACGPSFQRRDGHPNATVWQNDAETLQAAARMPETPAQARQMVAALADDHVDFIKIIVNGINPMAPGQSMPKLPWDIVEAIMAEARGRCLRVTVHTENREDAERAVRLGANEITHLLLHGDRPMNDPSRFDRLFAKMAEKNVYLTPTTIVSARLGAHGARSELEFMASLVKRARAAGVQLGAGTDAGAPLVPVGLSLHDELAIMVNQQGLSPSDAICAATGTNAKLIGKAADLGTVEPGKLADLIMVRGDPLIDISATRNIDLVMVGGRVLPRR